MGSDSDVQALLAAIAENKKPDVERILEKSPGILENTKEGQTALHMVAKTGNSDICEILLQMKANTSAENDRKLTPFLEAVIAGSYSILELLKNHGGATARSPIGDTCLHLAARYGHPKLVYLLGGKFQDYRNMPNDHKQNPLHCALDKAPVDPATVQALLFFKYKKLNETSKGNLDMLQTDENKQTVLHYAARSLHDNAENISVLAQLTDLSLREDKLSLSRVDKHGQTMLHVAAYHDRHSVIRFIATSTDKLEGQPTNSKENTIDGYTVSTWINKIDAKGHTALHVAALQNNFQAAKALLQVPNVYVNHSGNDGWTPLKCAAQRGHVGIVRLLLEARATPTPVSLSDPGGFNEVDACLQSGHVELARMMLAMQHNQMDLEREVGR
ncbi:hypothetical protein AAMO2058_001396000 [Amorphochlora amoebiformis]